MLLGPGRPPGRLTVVGAGAGFGAFVARLDVGAGASFATVACAVLVWWVVGVEREVVVEVGVGVGGAGGVPLPLDDAADPNDAADPADPDAADPNEVAMPDVLAVAAVRDAGSDERPITTAAVTPPIAITAVADIHTGLLKRTGEAPALRRSVAHRISVDSAICLRTTTPLGLTDSPD